MLARIVSTGSSSIRRVSVECRTAAWSRHRQELSTSSIGENKLKDLYGRNVKAPIPFAELIRPIESKSGGCGSGSPQAAEPSAEPSVVASLADSSKSSNIGVTVSETEIKPKRVRPERGSVGHSGLQKKVTALILTRIRVKLVCGNAM